MEEADTFRRIAADFTVRVEGVGPEGWEAEAPCEGWVARDIVRHLVEWVPWFVSEGTDHSVRVTADVDDDPAAAWAQLREQLQALLDRPEAETETFDSAMFGGAMPLGVATERFVTGDVLVHTWDLAKATDQDTSIDEAFAAGMYEGLLPMDDILRKSGHFGPRVQVPDDADPVTKLIAFTGRTP
jgi:uncharacterized protein (TIGR03086 family)